MDVPAVLLSSALLEFPAIEFLFAHSDVVAGEGEATTGVAKLKAAGSWHQIFFILLQIICLIIDQSQTKSLLFWFKYVTLYYLQGNREFANHGGKK
ncbi:hypothetical protein [Desulfocastanea catecholica]